MLELAIRYAFDILRVEKITLGVFENNEPAYRCYRAAGFQDVPGDERACYMIENEAWSCREMELTRGGIPSAEAERAE